MCGKLGLCALLVSAALMTTDAKAGSARIISVLSNADSAWNVCRSDGPVSVCRGFGYGFHVIEGYEPLGVYRPPREPRMYVIAPNAKIISLDPAR